MSAIGTLAAAANSSGLMPWIACAALAGGVAVFGAGVAVGDRWASTKCTAERLAATTAALEHEAKAVAKAQATSERIWSIGLTLATDVTITRTRQRTVIEEVERDVDAHPDLAACVVPVATQRLRDEQSADSQRATGDHPVQR